MTCLIDLCTPCEQLQAREKRYAALLRLCREKGLEVMMTAHHHDDQAGEGAASGSSVNVCNCSINFNFTSLTWVKMTILYMGNLLRSTAGRAYALM